MTPLLIGFYWLVVAALSVYGLLGFYTLWQYWRHRHDHFPCPPLPPDPPAVTIQLPIFNEPFVVKRLIRAAVQQQYPPHRLQIQVIDDSTDNTAAKAARLVAHYKRKGVNICLLRREERVGYKAGALAQALPRASGEYIAIFDADFVPPPDFLQQTIPHFLVDGRVGMVQARWGHLNDDESALTAVQALALDKHFALEQTVRHRAHLFPKFNGAGGVWRRACLEDAGGWQADTVCEDLCLSTRAQLHGWQFRFLPDVVVPAELPPTMAAYKIQQARWGKGATQCLRKYARPILTTPGHSWVARLVALVAMLAYTANLLVILLLLWQLPLMLLDYQPSAWVWLFTFMGLGQPLLFGLAQPLLHRDWLWRLRHFPVMVIIAVGMTAVMSRAVLQVWYGRHHPFIRTPKRGAHTALAATATPFDWIILVELALAFYCLLSLIIAVTLGHPGAVPFLTVGVLGYGYVGWQSWQELTPPNIHQTHPLKTNENQNFSK
ncbi:MAG: glycosyltransferase [Anaerolineae bacterium]|nr:glycosyltransferase [Anaerolineae bacterium]